MKIFIDISVLTLATFVTGIQRVTREIIVRLIENKELEVVLLHYNAARNTYFKIDNAAFIDYYVNNQGIKEKMITRQEVPVSAIKEGTVFFDLDAVWMSRMKRSYLLPIIKGQGAKIVAHIYDIISVTHPQFCLERGVYNFMDFLGAHLQYADRIITNAQATVVELEKLTDKLGCKLPECVVVPLGADFIDNKKIADEEMPERLVKATNEKPFILMVGTIEPRKNHKLLLDAYDQGLKALGYNIILTGYMGWNMEEFEKRLKDHPDYNNGMYYFEGQNDKEIAYLYQHAKFLAFLSYTEGFGLPIIEALQRGAPVIAADVPVLREVGGENCVWFEQDNVGKFLEKVKSCSDGNVCHEEKGLCKELVDVCSWEECGERIISIISSILEEN